MNELKLKLIEHLAGKRYAQELLNFPINFPYGEYYRWAKNNAQFRDKYKHYEIWNSTNEFLIFDTEDRFVVRLFGYDAQHFWNKLKGEKFFDGETVK